MIREFSKSIDAISIGKSCDSVEPPECLSESSEVEEDASEILNDKTLPTLRDVKDYCRPLERFFGLLHRGDAFGELALFHPHESR